MNSRGINRFLASGMALALLHFSGSSEASVTISSAATENMSCSGGVCAPTAADAVLNAGDLENLLAAGSVTVTTTGQGVQANDIEVSAPFAWTATSGLTLDAYQSIAVDGMVSVDGQGGISLLTNDGGSGGTLSFAGKGSVEFQNLSSQLAINGTRYTLVDSVATLASAIAANPAGTYALANNYDAGNDGTYGASPVSTTFEGVFEGLGNTISNLTIKVVTGTAMVGFFSEIDTPAAIRDLRLTKVDVSGPVSSMGGLVADSKGTAFGDFVSGTVENDQGKDGSAGGLLGVSGGFIENCSSAARVSDNHVIASVGGLAGAAWGTISNSSATGPVSGGNKTDVGGLVGYEGGVIDGSFASGAVTAGIRADAGGLAGFTTNASNASIANSYATGAVLGGRASKVGGLVGLNAFNRGSGNSLASSYSAGKVSGREQSLVGGLIGDDASRPCDCFTDLYWDMTTSGTNAGLGSGSEDGITGLSNKRFRAGLPPGFDPSVWAEDRKINNGLPYLIANPPKQK